MSSLKDLQKEKKMVNDHPLLTNKEPNLQKWKIDFKDYSNTDSWNWSDKWQREGCVILEWKLKCFEL